MGDLHIDHVIRYYNGPVLFVCRNELGHAFIAMAIDDDIDTDYFLYVGISEPRLFALLTGLIPLRDIYSEPESEKVYSVAVPNDPTGDISVSILTVAELATDWLPDPDSYLDEPINSGYRFSPDTVKSLARVQDRQVSAVRVRNAGFAESEFTLRTITEILGEFQGAASAVVASSGAQTLESALDNEMSLVGVGQGSFVFLVAPYKGARLIAAPSSAVPAFMDVLDAAAASDDTFRECLSGLSRSSISHVRNFFALLADANAEVEIMSAPPNIEPRVSHASRDRITSGLELLRSTKELPSERIQLRAFLTAIDYTKQRFGVTETRNTDRRRTPRKFAGVIDGTLAEVTNGLSVGTRVQYDCVLLRESTVPTFTEEGVKKINRLISIEPVDGQLMATAPVADRSGAKRRPAP
jgi:hypothetical protein